MTPDIKSLSKEIIVSENSDLIDLLAIVVPDLTPKTSDLIDQVKFEPFIRLKALPDDIRRLVATIVATNEISDKIATLVPDLGRATPTYYPSGIAELQWKLDDTSIFGLILSNFSVKLVESNGNLKLEKNIKVGWRFHGPRQHPKSGEFKSVEETLDFISKSFVT